MKVEVDDAFWLAEVVAVELKLPLLTWFCNWDSSKLNTPVPLKYAWAKTTIKLLPEPKTFCRTIRRTLNITLKRGKNNCNTNWYNKQNDIVSQNSCEINVNESNCGILNIQSCAKSITLTIKSTSVPERL